MNLIFKVEDTGNIGPKEHNLFGNTWVFDIEDKRIKKTLKQHGYSKDDLESYIEIFSGYEHLDDAFDHNNPINRTVAIMYNIEFVLNNPQHAKLSFELADNIRVSIRNNILEVCEAYN